jgi:hypothetical protein
MHLNAQLVGAGGMLVVEKGQAHVFSQQKRPSVNDRWKVMSSAPE